MIVRLQSTILVAAIALTQLSNAFNVLYSLPIQFIVSDRFCCLVSPSPSVCVQWNQMFDYCVGFIVTSFYCFCLAYNLGMCTHAYFCFPFLNLYSFSLRNKLRYRRIVVFMYILYHRNLSKLVQTAEPQKSQIHCFSQLNSTHN